ncbi:MAG: hypothetical protein NZM37_06005 [Sandaracinaceae bacterium]|nr:hypothetical protein [Sandaracinaceae bacterium]MDW8245393.1 hypothetical protein [Sandaracinaceae bacterium]
MSEHRERIDAAVERTFRVRGSLGAEVKTAAKTGRATKEQEEQKEPPPIQALT